MGVHSCSARLQRSSHASPGCTGSQWLGNTPGFSCSDTRALKTPIGKVFQPCSASRTAHDGSLAITDLLWDRPHADPALAALSASLVSMATAECQIWSWCTPQHLQLSLAPSGMGSTIWSCPQPPGCRTLHGQSQLQGVYFRATVQKGTLPPSREAHVGIFSRSARQTSSALPAIHLLCVFWAPQPFQIN